MAIMNSEVMQGPPWLYGLRTSSVSMKCPTLKFSLKGDENPISREAILDTKTGTLNKM